MRESLIDPLDNFSTGAVVARQAQTSERNIADTVFPDAQEQADIGLAKAVDRLHWVADDEQRAAVVALPTSGQARQQIDLRGASVLKLINQ